MSWRFSIRGWRWAVVCSCLWFGVQTPVGATDRPAQKPQETAGTQTAGKEQSAASKSSAAQSPSKKSSSVPKGKHSRSRKSSRKRGQKAIDSDRVREIQQALIQEHYLQGEPSGKWDAATQAAMQRYQADQGWQTKTVPDARALIKLGLGPNQDHLLNPESAMTTPAGAIGKHEDKPNAGDPQSRPPNSAAPPTPPAKPAATTPPTQPEHTSDSTPPQS